MFRRTVEVASVVSILAGAYLAHPGLLLILAGCVCLLIVDRTERSSK